MRRDSVSNARKRAEFMGRLTATIASFRTERGSGKALTQLMDYFLFLGDDHQGRLARCFCFVELQ
jgi:hypothetical protein